MAGTRSIILLLGALLLLGPTSSAQVGRELIARGKAATALVQVGLERGETTATAFCVDASGLFVTNAHVVRGVGLDSPIKLVLRSGEEDQKIVTARLYRRDEALDLALIRADPIEGVTALPLGRDEDLYETLATTAFGYPFGSVLAFQRQGYPNVSVNIHRISSLRKKNGELILLQLDGQLNPGNSGGPLLDSEGKVIGVAEATVRGSGINFAIPVGRLIRFLAAPGLDFTPPPLSPQNRAEPVTWSIRAIPATPSTDLPADLQVVVTVTVDQGKPRRFDARSSAPGTYEVTLTPMPHDDEAQAPGRLFEVRVEARQGTTVLATMTRRTELLDPRVPARVAPRTVVIRPVPGAPGIARRRPDDDGQLEVGGPLDVDGTPRGAGRSIRPPEVNLGASPVSRSTVPSTPDRTTGRPASSGAQVPPDAPLVRTLEGKIGDVVSGGAGRYLILTLKEGRKLAVFDVNAAGVVKTIPLRSDNALVAAGAKVLFLAYPDEKVIQRWDLESMTQLGDPVPSPIKGRLKALALGNDSDGPLLVAWAPGWSNPAVEQARFSFLDPQNLTVMKVGPITTGGFQGLATVLSSGGSFLLHPFLRERLHIRASSGGALFAIWQTQGSPSGFQTLVLSKQALRAVYNHEGLEPLCPGPDGRTVYTARRGPLDPDGKPLAGGLPEHSANAGYIVTIPTTDPAFYLMIEGLGSRPPGRPAAGVSASVHLAGKGTRLFTLSRALEEMGGMANSESFLPDDFTIEKRFYLVPAANLLITIPPANDRLVLRRLDIGESLSKVGDDSLVVTSPAALTADAGQSFRHQVAARSTTGGLKYAVALGPSGLTVSPEGALGWDVPGEWKGRQETVVLSVTDGSGGERFHLFRIAVR
jgi:hypothetical protein